MYAGSKTGAGLVAEGSSLDRVNAVLRNIVTRLLALYQRHTVGPCSGTQGGAV